MTPISLFETWLADVPTAQTFRLFVGDWFSFESSNASKFIAYRIAGGQTIREVETRTINVSLTIVGSKDDWLTEIETMAEAILKKTQEIPTHCDIVSVNMIGEIVGPSITENERHVLTMTLQMII